MKATFIALAVLLSPLFVFSQDITGLWTGTISPDDGSQPQSYEVYITKEKGKYSGYSKTCYLVDGKACSGIKKLKVSIAKDGKIVLLDDVWMENDHPYADKDFKQLNILDFESNESGAALNGDFVTKIKRYHEGAGKIRLKKADTLKESSLMRYLQKNSGQEDITVIK